MKTWDSFSASRNNYASWKEAIKFLGGKAAPDEAVWLRQVHACMVTALKQMDGNGFFAKGREEITLFLSSSHDDEAFEMENQSAKQLNPEQIYLPFLERYGDFNPDKA